MIIDHTNPTYAKKRASLGCDKYNGAYYYSKDIVKYIIPHVKTDRNWVTIRLNSMKEHPDHAIVFIHNNRNPNYYSYLKNYKDCVLVCCLPHTVENMNFFGKAIYLPLSVDIKSVEKYKVKHKTKKMAFAGRPIKLYRAPVPKECDILTDMPQSQLLKEMAKYETVYCTGRTAIQAKILGCKIGVHDKRFPDPSIWKVIDCKEAAEMLQHQLDIIDGVY